MGMLASLGEECLHGLDTLWVSSWLWAPFWSQWCNGDDLLCFSSTSSGESHLCLPGKLTSLLGTLEPWGQSPSHWRPLTTECNGGMTKTSARAGPGGSRCVSLELRSVWAIGVWRRAVPASRGAGVQNPGRFSGSKVGLQVLFLSLVWQTEFSLFCPIYTSKIH